MNLRRCLWSLSVVMLMIVGHPLTVKAMTLELSPTYQSVTLGTSAQVDVWLRSPDTNWLSTYDISLTFDQTILAYSSTIFSSALGDPSDLDSTFITLSDTGSLEIIAFPFFFDQTLQNGKADLLLFSLNFSTKSVGTSSLVFSPIYDPTITQPPYTILGDASANNLMASLVSGSIEVTQPTTPVPEPGTVVLLGIGLLCGVIFMKRKMNYVA